MYADRKRPIMKADMKVYSACQEIDETWENLPWVLLMNLPIQRSLVKV